MKISEKFSRRDFLKLSGMGLFTLGLTPPFAPIFPPFYIEETLINEEGRVADDVLRVYSAPTYEANLLGEYVRDEIVHIRAVTLSQDETAYNRVWYRVGNEGYVYSGAVQPIKVTLNEPVSSLPESGALAEVSVAFTDAYEKPDVNSVLVYRMYFSTTYWLTKLIIGADNDVWYEFYDDKVNGFYFAKAVYLRVIPLKELAPLSPEVDPRDKLIEVHLNDQLVIAYEKGNPVFVNRAATGGKIRPGKYYTPQGNFRTYHKRPSRHMAAGNLARTGFDLPGIPWVSYFTESGVSFHGTYWHNDFGHPRSHGCVNMTPQAARWIYLWSTPVVPQDKYVVYRLGEGTNVRIVE